MNKIFLTICLLLGGTWLLKAQSTHRLQVGLEGRATAFQDQKYSDSHYGGLGGGLSVEHTWTKANFELNGGVRGGLGKEQAATHSNGGTSVTNFAFQIQYLRKVKESFNLGLRWDVFDLYLRETPALQNNSFYFISSSTWYVSGSHWVDVLKGKRLKLGLDLGLASFFTESTGFAFSTSQNILVDGGFNYQDESLLSPFGLKNFVLAPIWKQLNIQTHIELPLTRRWSVGYHWKLRRFSSVSGYPTTLAQHAVGAKFQVLGRLKNFVTNPIP